MRRKPKLDSERPGRPWEHKNKPFARASEESYQRDVKSLEARFFPIVADKMNPTTLYSSLTDIKYPVLVTPKVRGVRCLTMEGGRAVGADLEDIPNQWIRETLKAYGMGGLDGVITIKGEMDKQAIIQQVTDVHDAPEFEYYVFDLWAMELEHYDERVEDMIRLMPKPRPNMIKVLTPVDVYDVDGMVKYWNKCVDDGHEGVAARQHDGLYTRHGGPAPLGMLDTLSQRVEGRSTIVGAKGEGNKLGAFVLENEAGKRFEVAHGYTDEQRDFFWRARKQHVGFDLTYTYNPGGSVPRNCVFVKVTQR